MEAINFKLVQERLGMYRGDPEVAGGFRFDYLDPEDPEIREMWGDKAGQVHIMDNETGETKLVGFWDIENLTMSDLPGEVGVEAEDPDSGPGLS